MLVPMDIMERVTIMRVVNKHFVKSIENTIKSMVYPDDVKEINYVVTVLKDYTEIINEVHSGLNNACKYLQHYMDEQIGTTYELRVYAHWKDGVTDDDEGALNPEELLSVSCKKQSNGKYWVSTNYFIDGCEVNKDEYL